MTGARWASGAVLAAALLMAGGAAFGQQGPTPMPGGGGHHSAPHPKVPKGHFPMTPPTYSHYLDKYIEMIRTLSAGRGPEMKTAIDKWVLDVRACAGPLLARGRPITKPEGMKCITIPADVPQSH